MVARQSQASKSKEQPFSAPLQMSALAGYQQFGQYLAVKRRQFGLRQKEMGDLFNISEQMYGKMERGRRAPQVDELVSMFAALVQVHDDKHLPPMQVIEVETFYRLAKAVIEQKQKKRPNMTKQQWGEIEQELLDLVDPHQRTVLHLVVSQSDGADILARESPNSRRRKALAGLLKEDLSHLLEREEWIKRVSTYPDWTPQLKVSVTQAGMGAGKSHVLALLAQHLAQRDDLFLVPYQFKHSETMTSDDHLDAFLATLYADLTMRATDDTKQRPLAERIDQALAAIGALGQKVVLLLDDAQEMFPTASSWSDSWHQFFETIVAESHTATMYIMTRTWPHWDQRKKSFLLEEDLPDLSVGAAILHWKRQGFDDVDETLLRKVCQRWGHNPQGIEMLAYQYRRRGVIRNWRDGTGSNVDENPHTKSLKRLLDSDTLFAGNVDEASRQALQKVFSNRMSGETTRLAECLALAPLGVPFEILLDQFEYLDQSFEDLVKASFADLAMAAAGRAAVVPLVREAVLQSLPAERKVEVEQCVTDLYTRWLNEAQDFRDDAEKAALIAEVVVRHIRARRLLKAAELFINFGWLCALFGQVSRIQRVFEEAVRADLVKDLGESYEAGRVLLSYHVLRVMRKKVDPRARDADFRHVHSLVLEGRIVLDPRVEIHLVHTIMESMAQENHYQEAYDFLQSTFDRITLAQSISPEGLFAFLHSKAYLLGRWSRRTSDTREATRLAHQCIDVFHETVEALRQCLKKALPLQERYYEFKLARVLNDLAYYARLLHRYDEAEQAIRECLFLKDEKKGDSSSSLALSLSEYGQLLVAKGQYRNANRESERAIELFTSVSQDDSAVAVDKGKVLVEQAHIFEMQGRLAEEKQLLRESLDLLPHGHGFRIEAEQRLARIQVIEESSLRYQLDSRWYRRYLSIAQFDELALLAQAGPLTHDEQHLWDQLYPQRNNELVQKQLEEIIGRSREREFEQSVALGHLPHIHYPALDIDDVLERIQSFQALKDEIAQEEPNVVVRRLYLSKIEEQLLTLRMIEATHRQDIEALRECNEALFGRVSNAEMEVALREIFKMLKQAEKHPQAREIAEQLLKQLKQWHLSAEDFLSGEELLKEGVVPEKLQQWRKTPVSVQAVQRWYEEILTAYGFTEWRVVLASDRTILSLNLERCEMYLPASKRFTVLTATELLAEEIETHIFRAVSGKRSKVALLGSGTSGFLSTEEGLARLTVQEMLEAQGLGRKDYSWITTLAPGMASGILVPAQPFKTLHEFLTKAFLIKHLRSDRYETSSAALEAAQYDSLYRVSRTFRGIPNLEVAGVCNLQDRVYLQGVREVANALQKYSRKRLLVGSIGIADLKDMEELHILEPVVNHQNLAHDPQLFDRIVALEK